MVNSLKRGSHIHKHEASSMRNEIRIQEILPATFPETGGKIEYELLDDSKISVRYFNYTNEKLNPRIPRAVTLSQDLRVDGALGAFVGLVLTEGLRSRRGECRSRFILMNCDLDVIKFFYHFLTTRLKISRKLCVFKLYYPSRGDITMLEKTKDEIKA